MERPTAHRWTLADLLTKVLLAGLLLFSVTHTGWARFADKAMVARAVLYPVLVALVPAVWWWRAGAARREAKEPPAYPGAAAFLFTLPFVVDIAGNALDLYDRVDHFDDFCHFANWALMCSALGVLLLRLRGLPAWAVGGLCVGFGAVVAIAWEIAEYQTFILDTPEASTAYRDTIGDLALGLSGSVTAGLAFAIWTFLGTRRGAPPTVRATAVPAADGRRR